MNHTLQALTANGFGIMLLCSLMVNFRRKYRRGSAKCLAFSLMLLVNLLQCIIEPVTIVLDGRQFPGAVPLSMLLNTLLYVNNILFASLWVVYAASRAQTLKTRSVWHHVRRFAPALLVIAGAVLNLFTPVYFTVSPENVYTRAGGFLFPYIVTYIYLLWGTVVAYGFGRRQENYVILPAVTFLLPVFLASIIQFFVPGISLLWAGSAIGLASAYISQLDETASIDALSGTFSRHHLNHCLHAYVRQSSNANRLAGIMLDIDRFKAINDTHGHLVGDDAIASIGTLLRNAMHGKGMVFRYAGDEFVILMTLADESQLHGALRSIRQHTEQFNLHAQKPYQVSFSCGHAIHEPGESSRDFLRRLDAAMYEDKNQKTP